MLNLIYASSLLYAAALYTVFVLTQSITQNGRVQYAIAYCKARFSVTADFN